MLPSLKPAWIQVTILLEHLGEKHQFFVTQKIVGAASMNMSESCTPDDV